MTRVRPVPEPKGAPCNFYKIEKYEQMVYSNISIIVAVAQNFAIGRNNDLLFHLPERPETLQKNHYRKGPDHGPAYFFFPSKSSASQPAKTSW